MNRKHIIGLYDLLGHQGAYSQLHAQDVQNGKMVSRVLVRSIDEVLTWAETWDGKANLFIGRNPRNEKGEIENVTSFSFDLDPIREKGAASTSTQLQRALAAGRHLVKNGLSGALASSGNGCLLIAVPEAPIRLTDKGAFENGCKQIEESARELLKDYPDVRLDSTFDVARLVKLVGTTSTKGDRALWRQSQFLGDFRRETALNRELFGRISEQLARTTPSQFLGSGGSSSVDIDRSGAIWAMASSLKFKGHDANYVYSAIRQFDPRQREDDCQRIITKLFMGRGTADQLYGSSSESLVRGPGSGETSGDVFEELWTPGNSLDEYRSRLAERGKRREPELPYGFPSIDECTYGLKRGDLSIVGARTGIGKTSLLLGVCSTLSKAGKRVLLFTTEMARDDVFDRLCSIETGIPAFEITTGQIKPENRATLEHYYEQFKERPLFISDKAEPALRTVAQAMERIRPDVVVFDHIQRTATDGDNVHRDISRFIKGLKNLCHTHRCAGLVASQLNRNAAFQAESLGEAPSLRHLAESGSLEQEAAVVILLSPLKTSDPESKQIMAHVAKNRYGREANVVLNFEATTCKFVEGR